MPPRRPIHNTTHFITPSWGYAVLQTSRPFAANHDLLQRTTHNNGRTHFTSLKHVNTRTFGDIHFDCWNLLYQNGLRLRRRNGLWDIMREVLNYTVGTQREPTLRNLADVYEVTAVLVSELDIQVKKGGTTRKQYDEQSEWSYQQRQLEEGAEAYVSLPWLDADTGYPVSFGLEVIARFKTQRQKWLVDETLELIIDETDFGHLIGKVEMRKSVKSLKEAAKLGKKFTREITTFIDRYEWIFESDDKVVGKLSAHSQVKKSRGCEG